jgi:hypothetical protein
MRLNKTQIEHMAFSIAKSLVRDGLVITDKREKLYDDLQKVIYSELEKEDLLDERVKEILKNRLEEIRSTNIDYF